jgi:4-amino-4-deoxy-L-arabinose transferase-like glycosyltransferase
MTQMRTGTCRTGEQKGIRLVAHHDESRRPQRDSQKTVRSVAQDRRSVFDGRFGLFACGVVLLWVFLRVFDFTLVPLAYNGLVITQPFCGLHSWDLADRAWAARSHLKYGLGYTKGLRTLVVGDPPPLIPEYYVSHPPLETWILAVGMLVFGTQDWSVRLFELVFSVPCLLLILLMLRKLHGSTCALLSGLILVLLPYSAYFGANPLMVVLSLWALYRYLLLTGRLGNGPEAKRRHLLELAVALFLLVQYNWVGIFYAFVISLHYVLTCRRRRQVGWTILLTLALPSLMSLTGNWGHTYTFHFWVGAGCVRRCRMRVPTGETSQRSAQGLLAIRRYRWHSVFLTLAAKGTESEDIGL